MFQFQIQSLTISPNQQLFFKNEPQNKRKIMNMCHMYYSFRFFLLNNMCGPNKDRMTKIDPPICGRFLWDITAVRRMFSPLGSRSGWVFHRPFRFEVLLEAHALGCGHLRYPWLDCFRWTHLAWQHLKNSGRPSTTATSGHGPKYSDHLVDPGVLLFVLNVFVLISVNTRPTITIGAYMWIFNLANQ